MLNLYSFFHLNLCYSSIEESDREKVIDQCYWPLLNIIDQYRLPIGIETTGYTLEQIHKIRPLWTEKFSELLNAGGCELIGSGYSQIIGPLVPAKVNEANLLLGNQTYQNLLGVRPSIALINEQAFSSGLIKNYITAGYSAIIMDWDNPYRYHQEWDPEWRYYPQIACGQHGEEIQLIWNHSISFQKFQRFTHGEANLDEYLEYLAAQSHKKETKFFSLYGNDTEIFDFRPGRFHTEAPLNESGEWERIMTLFDRLISSDQFQIIAPSEVLAGNESPLANHRLHLESPETPIPVKKQNKYNITRWALTGYNDLEANTLCWRIYDKIKNFKNKTCEPWKKLCFLWSSDFRTHITKKRWSGYRAELLEYYKSLSNQAEYSQQKKIDQNTNSSSIKNSYSLKEDTRHNLVFETDLTKVIFNQHKGLAIDRLWFKEIDNKPLLGTIPHGYYDDISMGADFFSGHMILEMPGNPKITDLTYVKPQLLNSNEYLLLCAPISTPLGTIKKCVQLSLKKPLITIEYQFAFDTDFFGSMKVGNISLIPESFDSHSLYFAACNGGHNLERFQLNGNNTNHGEHVSFLVSSRNALGLTDGILDIGDKNKSVRITVDKTSAALIGQIHYNKFDHTFFLRAMLSAKEMDETSKPNTLNTASPVNTVRYSISPLLN